MRRAGLGLSGRVALVAATLVGALVVDQLSKAWALNALGNGQVIQLVPTVTLELVFNSGVAFGIGSEIGGPLVVGLLIIVFALLSVVAFRTIRGQGVVGTVLLAAATGGALGNIWDRVNRAQDGPLSGHVVDFIAVDWFAVFNVADIFTTCGVAGWALATWIRERSHRRRVDG